MNALRLRSVFQRLGAEAALGMLAQLAYPIYWMDGADHHHGVTRLIGYASSASIPRSVLGGAPAKVEFGPVFTQSMAIQSGFTFDQHSNYHQLAGARGVVEIHSNEREVIIRLNPTGEWGLPVWEQAINMRLNISDFAETRSGIPWSALAERIRGYTIILYWIDVRGADDWGCVDWFNGHGCTVKRARGRFFEVLRRGG